MLPRLEPDVTPAQLQFRIEKIPPEQALRGWINGRIQMAVVHWDPDAEASKPCRAAMSGGVLPCRCATVKIPTRKIGYCPLLTQELERVIVIVSNGVARQLIPLGQGAPVILTKSKKPKAPLLWKEWPSYERSEQRTQNIRRAFPVDIEQFLFHVWGDDVLRRFHAEQPHTEPAPVPVDPPAPKKALGAAKRKSDNPVSLKPMLAQIGLPLDAQ